MIGKLLKKNYDKKEEALNLINESKEILNNEIKWRIKGKEVLLTELKNLSYLGKETFGLRKQERLLEAWGDCGQWKG